MGSRPRAGLAWAIAVLVLIPCHMACVPHCGPFGEALCDAPCHHEDGDAHDGLEDEHHDPHDAADHHLQLSRIKVSQLVVGVASPTAEPAIDVPVFEPATFLATSPDTPVRPPGAVLRFPRAPRAPPSSL